MILGKGRENVVMWQLVDVGSENGGFVLGFVIVDVFDGLWISLKEL